MTPEQEFEAFILRSFVETMLPDDATASYGSGTAVDIWKGMQAEQNRQCNGPAPAVSASPEQLGEAASRRCPGREGWRLRRDADTRLQPPLQASAFRRRGCRHDRGV